MVVTLTVGEKIGFYHLLENSPLPNSISKMYDITLYKQYKSFVL